MANSRANFTVRGVETEAEERRLTEELEELEGVQMADVDRETGDVEVRYGEELLSEERIVSAARDAGYEVD